MKSNKWLVIFLFFLGLWGSFAYTADAATTTTQRTAVVEEVVGKAWLQKAGGQLKIEAVSGMPLQEGDRLITHGAFSSVRIYLPDTKDRLLVGENGDIQFTSLHVQLNRPVTKVKVWSGTVYSSVNPVKSEQAVFEINAGNEVVSAKGTAFLVGVDSLTGSTYTAVLAGIVQSRNTGNITNPQLIFPAQQGILGTEEREATVSPIDLSTLTASMSPGLLQQLLKDREKMQQENEKLFADLHQQNEHPPTVEDLNRLQTNTESILGELVRKSIQDGKINEQAAQQLVDATKSPIDLSRSQELLYSEKERAALERVKKLEEERARLAEQKKQQQIQQSGVQQVIQRLAQQREEQESTMMRLMGERVRLANEYYKNQLEGKREQELRLFEEMQRKIDAAIQAQKLAAEEMKAKATPTPPPSPTRPSPSPISQVDRELAEAIAKVPTDLAIYTVESVNRLQEALRLPAQTNEQKVEKTGMIIEAIQQLEERQAEGPTPFSIHYFEVQLEELLVKTNRLLQEGERYEYWIDGEKVEGSINDSTEEHLIPFNVEHLNPDLAEHELEMKLIKEEEEVASEVVLFQLLSSEITNFDIGMIVFSDEHVQVYWDKQELNEYVFKINGEKIELELIENSNQMRAYFPIEEEMFYTLTLEVVNQEEKAAIAKYIKTDFSLFDREPME